MKSFLENNFNPQVILECQEVEVATSKFNAYMNELFELFFPVRVIKTSGKFLPNMTPELLQEIKKKKIMYDKCMKLKVMKSPEFGVSWESYKKQKNYVTKLSKNVKRDGVVKDLIEKSKKMT